VTRWLKRLLPLAALAALVVVLVARHLRGPLVPVARVTRADLHQTVVSSGRVLPPARIRLGGLTLARVLEVRVQEGDTVQKGQLLVQFDAAEARAALKQAQAQVARARAQLHALSHLTRRLSQQDVTRAEIALDEARTELKRQQKLARESVTPAATLERATRKAARARSALQSALTRALDAKRGGAAYRAALAGLAAAEAGQQAAEVRLARLRLVAPSAGTIVLRQVEPGDVVSAGATLLELVSGGAREILIEPDERNLALLAKGQRGQASTDALPGRRFPVRVTTIVRAVDRSTGTFRVKLAVKASPRVPALVADMTVSAEIVVARRRAALSIPRAAVRDLAAARPFALVLEDGRIERRALKLGLRGDRRVEVLAGLREAEQVVLATARPVAPGDRARPEETPPPAARGIGGS
jgi:HlyD family secretion protein